MITLREGLEAALIVAIILGYLKKVGAKALSKPVYTGIIVAILASVALGAMFLALSVEFEGRAEQIFEGSTMFLAAIILTSMILWMNDNSKAYSESLKKKVELAITRNQTFGLAALAFVSILREGIETVLFLGSTSFSSSGLSILVGGLLGLAVATLAGIAIIRYSVRIDLRRLFQVTGVVLVLFAAGLISRGIGEFGEAGIIPPLSERIWNTSWIIGDGSALGELLGSLFGYAASPSLAQVIGYVSYWAILMAWLYRDAVLTVLRRDQASARPE